MLADYWRFARSNPRFLAFGFLMAFLSGPGQTYFIGVFGSEIRSEFSLDSGQWGRVYMLGTLASAFLINYTGSLIDRVDLRVFSALSLIGLSVACAFVASINTVSMLLVSVFLLRQFGQGLTSHAGITSMVRYHDADRGKAVAIAAIGFACGEGMLPVLAILSIEKFGWRQTYISVGAIIIVSVFIVLWLLKGQARRHANHLENISAKTTDTTVTKNYTKTEMLKELRFYFMIPALIAPSMIITALFFFPAEIAEAKGWSKIWITGHYWLFSFVSVITTIYSGQIIDKLSASRVVPYILVPLSLSLASMAASDNVMVVWIYMAFLGISSGLYFTGFSTLWAELYGSTHIGSIKSFTNSLNIFASAMGPAIVGTLLDWRFSIEAICIFLAVFCLIATVLMLVSLRLRK